MFKYSIAALLLISLAACGGSGGDKSAADNGNGPSNAAPNATTGATSTGGVTVHISSGNGTDVVTASGVSNNTYLNLPAGTPDIITMQPGQLLHLLLFGGSDPQSFNTIVGAAAGDTFSTGTSITNSSWLASGKTATASFEANEVLVPNAGTASLADYANYTVRTVARESGDAAWFSFAGDTYFVENVHGEEDNFTSGTDVLVKFVGTVNFAKATIVAGGVVLQ